MSYSFVIALKDLASNKLHKIGASVGNLQSKVNAASGGMQKDFNRTDGSVNKINRSLNTTRNRIQEVDKEKTSGLRNRLSGIRNSLGGIVGLITAAGIAFAAWNGITAVMRKGAELEQLNVKFEVLLGSAENARDMLADLNSYANFTPYSNEAILKGAETMLAFGLEQERVENNMRLLGDVAMGNEEKLKGLSLVYSQIQSTGRLMGQDLLQLINQGFNPLTIISEQTGLGMGELKKKMEQGAISAHMVEEAFMIATSEGGKYNNMAERMAETAGGKWSTMMGKLSLVMGIVGEKILTWVSPLIDIGILVVESILPLASAIATVVRWVSECTPLLYALGAIALMASTKFIALNIATWATAAAQGAAAAATWLWNTAQQALNWTMRANPIGLVITLIAALIGAVIYAWKKFDWFRGGIMGIWEVMKGFGTMIKNYVINRFKELISGVTGIGEALIHFFNGDWKKAWEAGKKATVDLMGVNSKKKALEDGMSIAKNYNAGYEKGVKMYGKSKEIDQVSALDPMATNAPKSDAFNSLLADGGTGGSRSAGNGNAGGSGAGRANAIISGGSKKTNINVSFGKLIERLEIRSQTVEGGISDMESKVEEALVRILNSANQMQTG